MNILETLTGTWEGRGKGSYPTIDAFEYEERLHFEPDADEPLVHYEQKTILLPHREPSHWESGFILLTEDGMVEMLNAQNSGRVEVLRGRASALRGKELVLELESVVLAHDPRVIRSSRTLRVGPDTLEYVVRMATTTTPQPGLLQHLEARLQRSTGVKEP